MSDAESVVSEAALELRRDAERLQVDFEVAQRVQEAPRRRCSMDEQTAQTRAKVLAEREKEKAKQRAAEAKERAAQEKQRAAAQKAAEKQRVAAQKAAEKQKGNEPTAAGQLAVVVVQGRAKVSLAVPAQTTILQIKQLICDGRARNFKGVLEVDRIALYKGVTEAADDYQLTAPHELRVYVKRVTRGEKRAAAAVEGASAEPAVKGEDLSGEQLLQHLRAGGSLRNVQEQINAERYVDVLYKRLQKGATAADEQKKEDMLQALREWRAQSAPGFVQDGQARTLRNAKAFRAVGRGFAPLWQKATATWADQVGVTQECFDRELLGTGQRPSKRFRTLVAKPVPGPVVDCDSDGDIVMGVSDSEGDAK